VTFISGDLALPAQAVAVRNHIEKTHGALHLALLNHAYVASALFLDEDDGLSLFSRVMRTNFDSHVALTHHLLPLLHASSGRVAAIGTLGQHMPPAFQLAYITSKAALQGFFDSLAVELGVLESRVQVTYVAIGAVDTEQLLAKVDANSVVPFRMSPEASARDIKCILDRQLSFAFSPPASYMLSFVMPALRPIWTPIIRHVWVGNNPIYARAGELRALLATAG